VYKILQEKICHVYRQKQIIYGFMILLRFFGMPHPDPMPAKARHG
jgi:hypothetical protein